jgi:hypothetical protein
MTMTMAMGLATLVVVLEGKCNGPMGVPKMGTSTVLIKLALKGPTKLALKGPKNSA